NALALSTKPPEPSPPLKQHNSLRPANLTPPDCSPSKVKKPSPKHVAAKKKVEKKKRENNQEQSQTKVLEREPPKQEQRTKVENKYGGELSDEIISTKSILDSDESPQVIYLASFLLLLL